LGMAYRKPGTASWLNFPLGGESAGSGGNVNRVIIYST
jgi:hypothetical protein